MTCERVVGHLLEGRAWISVPSAVSRQLASFRISRSTCRGAHHRRRDRGIDAAAYEAGAAAYLRKCEDLPMLLGVIVAVSRLTARA
jgi:hypothetical protein